VVIDAVNGYENSDLTELIFSVGETNPANGALTRKIPSNEVLQVLGQPSVAQALQQKYSIDSLGPRCAYSEEQVRLDNFLI
jgi:hypothetical protein